MKFPISLFRRKPGHVHNSTGFWFSFLFWSKCFPRGAWHAGKSQSERDVTIQHCIQILQDTPTWAINHLECRKHCWITKQSGKHTKAILYKSLQVQLKLKILFLIVSLTLYPFFQNTSLSLFGGQQQRWDTEFRTWESHAL